MQNDFTNIGIAHRRYGDLPFGIRQRDRLLHMYIIGQTGTGKSTLLANLALQDAKAGRGFCLIEPHGDLARDVSSRLGFNHIYWDVADPLSPIGYNPIAKVSESLQPLVTSGLIDTLRRQWADAWGARMEHLLRYSVLALLAQPRADLRDVMRLHTDKMFRTQAIARVTDPQVLAFWTKEYPNMNYKTAIDGVAPIANKLGAFLAHPVIRAALCEPQEPLRFRRLMDDRAQLVINLSKGRLGTDVSNVVGGLIVSSIMHAAFSRYSLPESERTPFFLYIDEFHSFSTSALASMLSEVRKYGLGLVLAHQHSAQLDSDTFEAIMGNVGTQIVFRIGASDALAFSRQFDDIPPRDLSNLPNYRTYMKLMVDGLRTFAFSATMQPPAS